MHALHRAVRGHAVTETLRQLAARVEVPPELIAAAQELDKVYITSRYPNGFDSGAPSEYFDGENSRGLIGYAREIPEFCGSQIHRP